MTETAVVPAQSEPALTPFQVIEAVVSSGDISKMTPAQRVAFYWRTCESLGLNPLTRPFDFLNLGGKIVLYPKKDATDQLRRRHAVTIDRWERDLGADELLTVTVYGHTPDGRSDFDIGSVSLKGLSGEAKANATKKAVTQGKRRLTLSLVGLGFLDESEVEGIGARVDIDPTTGELAKPVVGTTLLDSVKAQSERLSAQEAPAAADVASGGADVQADAAAPADDIVDGIFAEVTAAEQLIAKLRDLADGSDLKGGPTDEQRARLERAYAGVAVPAVKAGIRAIWPDGEGRFRTAAEAAAVITVADSGTDEAFRTEWAAIAAQEEA